MDCPERYSVGNADKLFGTATGPLCIDGVLRFQEGEL
jgi:hypothetical protein